MLKMSGKMGMGLPYPFLYGKRETRTNLSVFASKQVYTDFHISP